MATPRPAGREVRAGRARLWVLRAVARGAAGRDGGLGRGSTEGRGRREQTPSSPSHGLWFLSGPPTG